MGIATTRRGILAGAAGAGVLAANGTAAIAAAHASVPRGPRAEWLYDATALLGKDIPHGRTIRGDRLRVEILGGEFAGPTIRGKIIPGGFDWQLIRSDGYWEIAADYFMETHDGVPIHVRNCGLWHSPTGDWPADYAVTTPQFEAPNGPYEWLNRYIYTGTLGPAGTRDAPAVKLSIFKLVMD
jgi:hypothetical protein